MFAGKPVIGIVGGIGSGKSHVSRLFGELGCLVIDSDRLVGEAYERPEVKRTLTEWWGEEMVDGEGRINREAIARKVFGDEQERRRLESLLHPLEEELRRQRMKQAADDPAVVGYVWDTPLLLEAGLAGRCDAVVYVDAPPEERFQRVRRTRGWSRQEWERREKSQLPLDKKRKIANDMVCNTADADEDVRCQVREVLSRILAGVRR